ncbi:MAG: hypothetical protein ICV69_01395 [Thermoleophilaceae bacterium]|nr:hypothetical protein [Thermoleophilaceae bacterium]
MLTRLAAMLERAASVRSPHDLETVLTDLCRTIADILGYRAVVTNVYRPTFDDMFTAAAVGREESVKAHVGRSSPRETWAPLLAERFERRGAYFVPGDEFDGYLLGVHPFPDRDPADDRDA